MLLTYQSLIREILKKASELLTATGIAGDFDKVDYVAIFSKSEQDYESFLTAVKHDGLVLKVMENGTLFKLNIPLETNYGKVALVKICMVDPQQQRIGAVDYEVDNFMLFKKEYLSTGAVDDTDDANSEELLTVSNNEVTANFPANPLGKKFI